MTSSNIAIASTGVSRANRSAISSKLSLPEGIRFRILSLIGHRCGSLSYHRDQYDSQRGSDQLTFHSSKSSINRSESRTTALLRLCPSLHFATSTWKIWSVPATVHQIRRSCQPHYTVQPSGKVKKQTNATCRDWDRRQISLLAINLHDNFDVIFADICSKYRAQTIMGV